MNCFRCHSKFDQIKHTPKLLIMCGHSLCQKCCNQLFRNGKIQCIQCKTHTFLDRISSLPKNLALISQKISNSINNCSKHDKKYQAFCFNEKMLICIECILYDGHKNHEMNSIQKSFQVELELFKKKVQKIESYSNMVKEKAQENVKIQNQFLKNYQLAHQTIKSTFSQIRQLITQQQSALLQQIQTLFKQNQQKITQRDRLYSQKILQIQQILLKVQNSSFSDDDIDFLKHISQRQQTMNSIKFNSYENVSIEKFNYTKNSIFENVVKILNLNKINVKGNNSNGNVGVNNVIPVNIQPKNQKNVFNNNNQPSSLRGFRKAAFSNISNCQNNNKQQKKVSSRKQSITHHVHQQQTSLKAIDNKQKVPKTNNNMKIQNLSIQNVSNTKGEKMSIKKIGIMTGDNVEISVVDPRQSLCNSFMSGVSSFINQKRFIYIIGGFNQQNDNILKLDLNSMQYSQLIKLNSNRSKFGSIFIDKKLYLFGGKKGKQRLNDIQSYDIEKLTWNKVGTMNKNRSGFGIVSLEDEIYIIGGNDGESILNTVETFNVKTKEWKKLASMNQARDQLAVVVGNDDRIYAIGGFGGVNNEPLKTVQYYDIKLKQWKNISKMKYARRALSAAILADGIYAIGGFDGSSYMSLVQKYDYINDEWVQISSMNVARCTHSSIAVYQTQQIFVFGGFDYLPLNSVEKYSLITNQWENVSEMPVPRFMHSSVVGKM